METGTFLQEDVVSHMKEHFIALKYESGRDAEQFMRFNVRATPTFVVLDAEGSEIDRIVGFYNPDDFIGQLESVRSKKG